MAELEGWLKATPAQRLRWLEQAIEFAHSAGALPRRDSVATGRVDRLDEERDP
jgi:hypothetical protein